MSMAISRVQELQDCFPQLSRGTLESVLDQVGSERAVDVLLEMTSDSGECASHEVDIHPSQLMGALLPTEATKPYAASPSTSAPAIRKSSDNSYLSFRLSPQPPSPVPLQRRKLGQPPLPLGSPNSLKLKQEPPASGQHAWWPAWQGGVPVAQSLPPQPPPADTSADDTPLEELLNTLNSGSDDSCSEFEADLVGRSAGKHEAAVKGSPKLRPYDPAAAGSAAASPRPGMLPGISSADGSADGDNLSMEQLLLDMIGGETLQVKDNCQSETQAQTEAMRGLDDHQQSKRCHTDSVNPILSNGLAPASEYVHSDGTVGAPELQPVELQRPVRRAVASAEPSVGAVSPTGPVAGCAGDGVVTSNGVWSSVDPWPETCASPWPDDKRRAPSAAEAMYRLSGGSSSSSKRSSSALTADRGRSRSRQGKSGSGASREGSAAKSETSSLSSGGAWDNTEDALAFLKTCFPGNPLVGDLLAGCGGDANAATAKLLEMRDDEQAHALAQAMQGAQELSITPTKVDMDEEQKLERLTLEFPELSAAECSVALAAQAGNLAAAVAILDMHVSAANAEIKQADFEVAKRVAAEEERAHERAVADQQAADFAMAMGLQDVAAKEAKPSPAASPEDLAAIAALDAGADVVLQPPRTPSPLGTASHRYPAYPYLLTKRAPPPPPPPTTYAPHSNGHTAQDRLWKELRGPAEAIWNERRETMDAAATAYRKGRKAQGEALLREAAALKERAEQKESEASHAMFRAKNLDLNMPTEKIDLHGQKVAEARDMLVDLLGPHIKYRHKPVVEIVTGRGLHSEGGEARIKPMVRQYLQEQGLHFTERPGSYQVHFHA